MKTLKERIAIEQALLDGEIVQEFNIDGDYTWDCGKEHIFYWNCCDYRIKPKPMEFWVNVYNSTVTPISIYYEKSRAENAAATYGAIKTIKVKEVIE